MGIYLFINKRTGVNHIQVDMPEWVPFWPVMALPYLAMLLVPVPMQLAIRDQKRFHDSLLAVLLGFIMIASVWIFFPTELVRPAFERGWDTEIYRWMVGADKPVNILPAGHALWPVIGVYFLAQERRSWLWWMLPLLLFGMMTIATTWQHRPVDIVIGTGIPLGAAWFSERWRVILNWKRK